MESSKRRTCKSDRDGECDASDCPQLRDDEPQSTGRSCPLYEWSDEESL